MGSPQVAFLGLGAMGRPMARNLARAGYAVRAWNRTARAFDDLRASGVEIRSEPEQAVSGAQAVFMCVLDDKASRAVVARVLPHLTAGAVILDHSTIGVSTARDLARRAASRGVSYLDAPVSGGVSGAEQGTLTIFVGGDAGALRQVEPLLRVVGERIYHMGPSGAGQAAKLVNQLLTAVHQAAAVEALVLAQRAGLDLERLVDALQASYGQSRMLLRTLPVLLEEKFDSPFTVGLLRKDLMLVCRLGDDVDAPVPMASWVLEKHLEAERRGLGDRDAAILSKVWGEVSASRSTGHER